MAVRAVRGATQVDDDQRDEVLDATTELLTEVLHRNALTNDGELSHRLTHPSYEVPKTYLAEVIGPVARDVGRRLKAGVELEDGPAKADEFRLVSSSGNRVMLELVLHEGRKHVVRRLLEAVGHPVQRLVRTAVGPVLLGDQRAGKMRPLTPRELAELFAAVGL